MDYTALSPCRGLLYQPTICGRIAPLTISVDEPLVWRLYDVARGLATATGGGVGGQAGGAGASAAASSTTSSIQQRQQSQVATAELPLLIDLLTFDDVQITLSTRTDMAVRPRWANQVRLGSAAQQLPNSCSTPPDSSLPAVAQQPGPSFSPLFPRHFPPAVHPADQRLPELHGAGGDAERV
jgi:hypothetical protein